jgi:hypothetical protein
MMLNSSWLAAGKQPRNDSTVRKPRKISAAVLHALCMACHDQKAICYITAGNGRYAALKR